MIGIDITNLERFKKKSTKLVQRILSKEEFNEYDFIKEEKEKIKFLATRWCIKEAIFKADNEYSNFNKINIVKESNSYKFPGFVISTSRENNMLVAIALKTGKLST